MNVIFIFQRYIINSYINVKKLLKFDFYFIATDY